MVKPIRKPEWLRVKSFSGEGFDHVNRLLKEHGLNTVCQAANCPNRGECFNRGIATFLILGPVCTRNCRFCDISSGTPHVVDVDEPRRVAEVSRKLELKHVVVTSVTRDDLPDGGAEQFARTVRAIKEAIDKVAVEVLTPDFIGKPGAADIVINSQPNVFNHNVETVPDLYHSVRPGADYEASLRLLRYVHDNSDIVTKTGLMVGLGETREQLNALLRDIAYNRVSILTIGQYLAPSREHWPVARYVHPDEFAELKEMAQSAGIPKVVSAPLVRSSYKADVYSLESD